MFAAQYILDIPLPVEHLLFIAKNHAGIAVIDIGNNGGDLRVQFPERLHKIIF